MRINKTFINMIIYTGMSFFQKAITFLMLPVYTATLSPSEFGMVNMVISVGAIYILLFTFSLDEGVVRFYFEYRNNPDVLKRVLGSIIVLSLCICAVGSITLLIFNNFLYKQFLPGVNEGLVILSIVIVVTSPVFAIYQKLLRIKEKAKEYAVTTFVYSLTQIILTLLFVVVLKLSSFGYLLAITITSALMFCYCILAIRKEISFVMDKDTVIGALRYSGPLVPYTLSSWGLSSFTQIALGKMLTLAAVGIFNAINYLGAIVNVLSNSIINAWQPWVYRRLEEGETGKALLVRVTKFIGLTFISFGFALSLFANELIQLVINRQYHSGIIIAPIIIYSSIILLLGSLVIFILYYEKTATKYAAVSTIVSAITNIILSLLLIPIWGIVGAAISLSVANIINSIIKQIFASKIIRKNFLFPDLYLIATVNLLISIYTIQNSLNFIMKTIILVFGMIFVCLLYQKIITEAFAKIIGNEK